MQIKIPRPKTTKPQKTMNSCEPLQIAKMNLRVGRGRSMEQLTALSLRKLRAARSTPKSFVIQRADWVEYHITGTLRQAIIACKRKQYATGMECHLYDYQTSIRVY